MGCTIATTADAYIDSEGNAVHPISICKDDKATLENNGNVIRVEDDSSLAPYDEGDSPKNNSTETTPNNEEIFEEQEECGKDTCCKSCSTPGAPTDTEQLMNVLVTVTGFEAIFILDSCTIATAADAYIDSEGNAVHPISICKDDKATLENNSNVIRVEDDTSSVPSDNQDENVEENTTGNEDNNNSVMTDPPTVNEYNNGGSSQEGENSTYSETYSSTKSPDENEDNDNNQG